MRAVPSIRPFSAVLLALALGALQAHGSTVSGPLQVGNGIPDGLGATAGLFFFKVSGLPGGGEVPIALAFTSGSTHAEPVTCSAASPEPCSRRGLGLASVNGFPTSVFPFATGIKLGAATYLGRSVGLGMNEFHGYSLEMALEGALYAGDQSVAGAPADLRLFEGNALQLLEWGSGSTEPSQRPFPHRTGSGILLGDEIPLLFPGWLRGRVDSADGSTILVRFHAAEVLPASHPSLPGQVRIEADPMAASAAGLPAGSFGLIEVNHSGLPGRSAVFDGASSNDLEVSVTTRPDTVSFLRGDCNGDLSAQGSVSDAVFLLTFNFAGGKPPPCLAACDADGDGNVTGVVNDAIYLLRFGFISGPAPPVPFPACGTDPDPRGVSCDTPPGC